MKPRQQILWHQGLFLQPQHLQVQDLVNQALLAPVYRFALPHFWGVGELALDEGALAEGAVVLQRGSFLFQDGSFAVLRENAVAEGRGMQDAWQGGAAVVTVYLGLRRWNDSGANVSFSEDGAISGLASRLVATDERETVCDLHAGGPPAEVRRQSLLLKLFWEGEVQRQGEYHLIPIARLERTASGARVVREFVPPVVSLAASPWLTETLSGIRTLLSTRLAELRRRRAGEGGGVLATRGDVALIMAQRSLGSYLPLLDDLAHAPACHPRQLYVALSRLIGELSTCSPRGEGGAEPGLLPYDHGDLFRSFVAARDRISSLLEEIVAAPDDVVAFLRDGDLYSAKLDDSLFAGGKRYFLSLRSKADPQLVLRALQSTVKVSTRDHLKVLSARALPGIGLTHTPITPPGLVPRLHTLYVQLDQHHDQWRMVSSQHNLALHWDDSPSDLEVELVVLGSCSAP